LNRWRIVKTPKFSRIALAAGLLLLAGCASSRPARPVDPELSGLSQSGRAAFERGDYKLAARFYGMARHRARVIDDPAEIGTVTYNLAAVRLELGETERAAELLREARRAFSRGPGVPVDLPILQARVALLRGRPAEAEEIIAEGTAGGEKDLEPAVRLQFQLLRARMALAGGDMETARTILEELRDPVGEMENNLLQADYASLSGELLFLEGDYAAAARRFDREAALLFAAARYRGMTRARERAGRTYFLAEDFCPAGDRFYRAARSRAARGESAAALELLQAALEAAEGCPQEALREEIFGLLIELEQALEETPPPAGSE